MDKNKYACVITVASGSKEHRLPAARHYKGGPLLTKANNHWHDARHEDPAWTPRAATNTSDDGIVWMVQDGLPIERSVV